MDRLLVLGGTSFVGRAVVEAAVARGARVTTLNRGRSHPDLPGVEPLRADRNDPTAVCAVLGNREFDGAIDVSGLAPAQVRTTVDHLHDRVPHYTLVSTVSTYADAAYQVPAGAHITEDAATVPGDPDEPGLPEMQRYGEQKRGCELAVTRRFGARSTLVARPGVILGPHENVHRVPYWLGRMAASGEVMAPGHAARDFQFVDVRDLAGWLVTGAAAQWAGTYNAVNPTGRDTWGDWLRECRHVTGSTADLTWVDDETLVAHGVNPGFDLPLWFGSDVPGFDDARIRATGFSGRPLAETVRDSWEWLLTHPNPPVGARPAPLSRAAELRILASLRADPGP